jgi:hypothetical protein
MSQAWIRLRAAVHILGQEGSARERLATASSHYLLGLKPKELPPEIRTDFVRLMQWVAQHRKSGRSALSGTFEQAKDAEVTSMIHLIIDMYDAVTRYEPILPLSCSSAARRRSMPANSTASAA